jgi:hypothetical protein
MITTTAPHDRRVHLTAGRLLERIHLGATAAGIALQHMNQITERIDRVASTGAPASFAPWFAAGRPTPRRSADMVLR